MENNENTESVLPNAAASDNNGKRKGNNWKERFISFWFYNNKHIRHWRAFFFGSIGVVLCAVVFPYFLRHVTHIKVISEMGPYGDVYGGLNTFFTGLAFVGLIITIALQHQEMRETRKEFEEQTNLMLRQNINSCMFEQLKYMQNQKEDWEKPNRNVRNVIYGYLENINEFCMRIQNNDNLSVSEAELNAINGLRREINGTSTWSVAFRLWRDRISRVISSGENVDKDRKEFVQSFWELVSGPDKVLIFLRFVMYDMEYDKMSNEMLPYFKNSAFISNFIALRGYNKKRFSLFYHIVSQFPHSNPHSIQLTKEEISAICEQYKKAVLKDVDILSLPE